MAHSRPKRFTNWYLREWLASLGVSQARLADDTGLGKTAVSLLINERQDYTPAIVQTIADYLKIAPYELLLHPADANAIKQIRKDAIRMAAISERLDNPDRTGTNG